MNYSVKARFRDSHDWIQGRRNMTQGESVEECNRLREGGAIAVQVFVEPEEEDHELEVKDACLSAWGCVLWAVGAMALVWLFGYLVACLLGCFGGVK